VNIEPTLFESLTTNQLVNYQIQMR